MAEPIAEKRRQETKRKWTDDRGPTLKSAVQKLNELDANQQLHTDAKGEEKQEVEDMSVVEQLATSVKPQAKEETVRRAYTLYKRQDDLLRDLAYNMKTDKSDLLRQIVDAWINAARTAESSVNN